MSKETLKETVKKITHLDSMKAVKVAFDLSESNQDSINKLAEFLHDTQKQLNMLATKVLELEKKLEMYEPRKN